MRRRQRGDGSWKERGRRKAQRQEARRRPMKGGRKYAWRRADTEVSRRPENYSCDAVNDRPMVREKQLDEREGRGTRVRNRCVRTGNGRSVRRWFRRSGRKVRERGRRGKLQGVYKVSW
jgi:ribosomal protein S14